MRLALLLLVALSLPAEGLVSRNNGWPVGQAEQALRDNVRDIFGGTSISIADGAILCDLERCYAVRASDGAFEFVPVKDADFLSAVRIYRYKIAARAVSDTLVEQAATSASAVCASNNSDDPTLAGDAVDCFGAGLDTILGGVR